MPAGLVLGISVGVRHDDRLTHHQTWWSAGHAEVLGYTELVNDVRRDARSQLHLDVQRLGAEGVVIADVSLQIRERKCPSADPGNRPVRHDVLRGWRDRPHSRAPVPDRDDARGDQL